jgi:hypothetical protein
MKKKRFWGMVVLAVGVFFTGCATNIPVRVIDPARLDMSGITRIAVMPFKTSDSSTLHNQTSMEISEFLKQQLGATGRFQMVSSDGIAQAQDRSAIADAVIEGQIILLSVKDGTSERKVKTKDDEGNEIEVIEVTYLRDLSLEFSYSITRTRDNSSIVNDRRSQKASDRNLDRAKLAEPFTLAKRAVSSALGKFAGDVAPSSHTENRTLAALTKEEAKDKALKQQMAEAVKLAKAKNYTGAAAMYGSIYASRGTFAAGYNEALLTEATDGVAAAIELMADLYAKTNNIMAGSMLASMRRARSGDQRAEQQRAEGRPLAEAAIEQVSSELLENLPQGSRISLVNNSREPSPMLDSVIGGIFDKLSANGGGITVLDRQNQSFIDIEIEYQLSGLVDDNAAVSIGHALGLTAIVFCSIDGAGSRRQLRVRAVDIETGAVIYTVSLAI